jgi:hypothetical protein
MVGPFVVGTHRPRNPWPLAAGRITAGVAAVTLLVPWKPARAEFVDVANATLADTQRGWGVAWGDYDKDGDLDLLLMNTGFQDGRIFRNDGGDSFVIAPGSPLGFLGLAANWGDYDDDGDLDIYLTIAGAPNKLYENQGNGSFTLITSGPQADASQSYGFAWVDIDNDHDLDLYVANNGQANRLFRNEGDGTFADATETPLDDTGNGQAVTWGDYDNDGDLDVYLSNLYSPNNLLRNDGGTFADVTIPPLDNAGPGRGAAWGDYDNDGDLDLYLVVEFSQNRLLRNDGAAGFTDVTTGPLGVVGDTFNAGWLDYDNDADLDLYVVNFSTTTPNKLLRNDGGGVFTDVVSPAANDSASGIGMGCADYDQDGDVDIYVANYEAPNRLLRNDFDNGNHWLHVDLSGTASNRLGIGARVRVVAGGVSQIHEVEPSSGFLAQHSFIVEFGLGAATVADTLEIRWPSGIVQDMTNVSADQRLNVVERDQAVAVGDRGYAPGRLGLSGGAPSPFAGASRIVFTLATDTNVRLSVHDLAGRLVTTLVDGWRPAGVQAAVWDGRNDGRPVGTGVYLLRLQAGSEVRSGKIVLMR